MCVHGCEAACIPVRKYGCGYVEVLVFLYFVTIFLYCVTVSVLCNYLHAFLKQSSYLKMWFFLVDVCVCSPIVYVHSVTWFTNFFFLYCWRANIERELIKKL